MAFRNPLNWPEGQRRTVKRRKAPFEAKTVTILNELDRSVRKLGITDVEITTDRRVRVDGQVSMAADNTIDPGIAIYFKRKGEDVCIAFDRFNGFWGNLRAIGLYLEYMARLESYDMTEIADKAFTGFTALPAHATPKSNLRYHVPKDWYEVLQLAPTAEREVIRAAYRKLSSMYHPDNRITGDPVKFQEVQRAYRDSGAA
jgi:hypothetical protein